MHTRHQTQKPRGLCTICKTRAVFSSTTFDATTALLHSSDITRNKRSILRHDLSILRNIADFVRFEDNIVERNSRVFLDIHGAFIIRQAAMADHRVIQLAVNDFRFVGRPTYTPLPRIFSNRTFFTSTVVVPPSSRKSAPSSPPSPLAWKICVCSKAFSFKASL